jgi:hypothetical protein
MHPGCTRDVRHVSSPSLPLLLQECGPSLSSQPGQLRSSLSSLQRYSDSMPDVVPSKVRVRVRVRLR